MSTDNRAAVRRTLHLPARLTSGQDTPQQRCVLLDISDTGARLEIAAEAEVPDKFKMMLTPRGEPFRLCEVVWRGKNQVGVAFANREPQPASLH